MKIEINATEEERLDFLEFCLKKATTKLIKNFEEIIEEIGNASDDLEYMLDQVVALHDHLKTFKPTKNNA